jgi:hypothetical protein
MSFWCRVAGLSPILLILVLAACGGGGNSDSDATATPSLTPTPTAVSTPTGVSAVPLTPTATPSTSSSPTPAASPSPTATSFPSLTLTPEPPHAAPIAPDPGATSLAENVLLPVLRPKAYLTADPVTLLKGVKITPPSCADLVFYLSWQVRSPYPPTDVDVEVRRIRTDGAEVIGEGTSGQASSGCGEYRVINNSDMQITVEVRYTIANSAS